MKIKLDLSKTTNDELIKELYRRDDIWLVQFFDVGNIQHISEKKISAKKAKEVLTELKSCSYWQEKISNELSFDIDDILQKLN